jgi:hypothetical protein
MKIWIFDALLAYLCTFTESSAMLAEADHLNGYFTKHAPRDSFLGTVPPPIGELLQ